MTDFLTNIRRGLIATKRLARACYEAEFDESFDSLNPKGIEYALALQVGAAALKEMEAMSRELKATGEIGDRAA